MATLKEDILTYTEWIVKAFKEDGFRLDYTVNSFLEVDRFIQLHTKNGQPIKGRRLSKNMGTIIFALASYVGETLIKTVPNSTWITDDDDPKGEINIAVQLGGEDLCWPGQKVVKRIQNGLEDGIYPYGISLIEKSKSLKFNESFWDIERDFKPLKPKKPWWKF